MALLGGASDIRRTGIAQSRNASRLAQRKRGGGGGGGGISGRGGRPSGAGRPYGGGGISRARAAGGQARAFGTAQAAPRAPRYTGPPAPTAAMIAQLAEQLGGLNRRYREAGATYKAGVGQAQASRKAFLQQLGDFYTQQQNQTASDFQARGLLQSGLYNEALANLGKQRAAQQGQYETDYRSSLADLLRTLTTTRAGLSQQRAQLSDRYQQSRADRARILRLMGA